MIDRGRALLGQEIVRKILSGSFVAFGVKIASAGLSFLMFLLLARAMGQTEYGVFGAAFSLATLLAVVGTLGQRSVVVRFAALYDEAGKHALRRGVTRFGYVIVTLGCLVTGGIAWTYYQVTQVGFDPWLVAAVLAMTLAFGLAEYQSYVLRVTTSVGLALIPRDVVWRVAVCLGAWGVLLASENVDAALASWFVASSLLVIVAAQLLYHEISTPETRILGTAAFDAPRWRQPMLHLWLSSVIRVAAPALSVVLIERFTGPDAAGPFFAAMRTAQLLNLFILAIDVIGTPMLSRSLSRDDFRQTQQVCTFTAAFGGLFGLLGYLVFLLFGGRLLGLFGPEFDMAYPALLILAFGFLVNAAAGPTGPLLEMSGHERYYSSILLASNGLGVLAMPFAIWWFGVLGAAACTAFAAMGWNIAAWVYCRRKLGVDPSFLAVFWPPCKPEGRAVTSGDEAHR